ncbi:hypothetical protein LPN04_29785 [Rugamonas sp. A1-17]|nr:hypothetical protein [Rugamonas sp. A1-17]
MMTTKKLSLLAALMSLAILAHASDTPGKTTIYYGPSGKAVFVVDGKVIGTAKGFQPAKDLKFRSKLVAGDTPDDPDIPLDPPLFPAPTVPKPDPTPVNPVPSNPIPPCASKCCDVFCPPGTMLDRNTLIHWAPVYKNFNVIKIKEDALSKIR